MDIHSFTKLMLILQEVLILILLLPYRGNYVCSYMKIG